MWVFEHGGVERFVFDLVSALRLFGVESRVVAVLARREGSLERAFREQGVPIFRCHLRKRSQLQEVLRQALDGVTVVHSHLGVYSGDVFRLLRQLTSARLVAHEHTLVRFPWHKRWYESVSHVLTLRHADAFAAVSEATTRRLMKGDKRPCALVPPGVRLDEWPRRERQPDAPPWRLLMAARFDPVKNHLFAVQVASMLRDQGFDFILDLLGDGPMRPCVEREVLRHGLSEVVRFHGVQSDVASWMRDAHLLLLPSLSEGAPRVLIEASAVGLPFLTSDRVDVSGLFSGEVVVPLSVERWVHAVKERAHSPVQAQPLIDLSIERAARDLLTLYGIV